MFLHEIGTACGAAQMFYTEKQITFSATETNEEANFADYKRA